MSPRLELIQLQRPTSFGAATECFRYTGVTGIIAAGIGAGSVLMGASLGSGSSHAWLERVSVTITVITAFAVPVTAGRMLKICNLDQLPSTGGGALVGNKISKAVGSAGPSPGSIIVANTTPLSGATAGGAIAFIPLSGVGAAGSVLEYELTFGSKCANMLIPEDLGIASVNAFDAGGTFEMKFEVDYEVESTSGF